MLHVSERAGPWGVTGSAASPPTVGRFCRTHLENKESSLSFVVVGDRPSGLTPSRKSLRRGSTAAELRRFRPGPSQPRVSGARLGLGKSATGQSHSLSRLTALGEDAGVREGGGGGAGHTRHAARPWPWSRGVRGESLWIPGSTRSRQD